MLELQRDTAQQEVLQTAAIAQALEARVLRANREVEAAHVALAEARARAAEETKAKAEEVAKRWLFLNPKTQKP
jgi:hypothetical protein